MNHHNDVVRREAATFKRSNVDINSSSKVNKTRKYEDKEYSHLSTIKGISVHRASEVDLINGLTTCLISFLPLKIRVRVNFFYHRPTWISNWGCLTKMIIELGLKFCPATQPAEPHLKTKHSIFKIKTKEFGFHFVILNPHFSTFWFFASFQFPPIPLFSNCWLLGSQPSYAPLPIFQLAVLVNQLW